jgi:hypothetical protein
MKEPEEICKVPFIGDIINSNFNIPEQILDAYFRLVPQPAEKDQISSTYVGKPNWFNSPHQVSVYGAYPIMIQWEMIEYKMNHSEDDHYKAYQRDTVFEYLKEFAKGFQSGYDNFLTEKIADNDLLSTTETSKAQAIMDFLSSPFASSGFSESHGTNKHIFSGWYEDGKRAGYSYRAWIIILKNHKLFEPFFEKAPVVHSQIEAPSVAKKEFTTARQVLALHYIFEQLEINNIEIDRTSKADFAEFLTAKNNKNLYDAFQNPFATKQKQFRFEDLQFIRTYFEKLGLGKIVKQINDQLEKSK